ncbi:MAG: acylphosphatase [Candidatus Firestonebacteria bacterium]
MKKQVHIFYIGLVQGIGFRYTAQDIASDLGISGWVKNLQDGKVELVAEGEEDILKDLLLKIKENFTGYIKKEEIEWLQPTHEFKKFEIRY